MKKYILLLSVALISLQVYSQNCEVKLEDISGAYEGDCKKGLANGTGKASGTDTYEGSFKKGLPDGQGTYIWANGDVYVGEFKKGVKSGAGKITTSEGEKTGYWLDGDYIGTEKYAYKMLSADSNISDIKFARKGDESNEIIISYELKGRRTQHDDIVVTELQGNYASLVQEPWTKTLSQVSFPFRFNVTGKEAFDVVINQPGKWEVKVILVVANGLNVNGK